MQWWTVDELVTTYEVVKPPELAWLLAPIVRGEVPKLQEIELVVAAGAQSDR